MFTEKIFIKVEKIENIRADDKTKKPLTFVKKTFYAKENFKQNYSTSSNLLFSCSFKPLFTSMFCAL